MTNSITRNNLSTKEFNFLSATIYEHFGIKMPINKKTLLECRLQKRLKSLEMNNFGDYVKYIQSGGLEKELYPMANVVTTNKTDFFRESGHFDYLKSFNWDFYFHGKAESASLKVWSSACSSGEEPYTIAIVLQEMGFTNYRILATDISQNVLQKAHTAIYPDDRIIPVPKFIRHKYFMKSKDKTKKVVRVSPIIRKKVEFQQLNLMDDRYEVPYKMDMIFCRNVLIYFDRITQKNVVTKLIEHLKPGGLLFIGHSESISDLKLPLEQVKSTIYRKII